MIPLASPGDRVLPLPKVAPSDYSHLTKTELIARLQAAERNSADRPDAESELGEVSSRLAAIVDSSDDAIISKSLDGTIVSWNRGAEQLFGYTANEVIGRSMQILFPEDRADEETKLLAQIERGEIINHFETVRIRKDGTRLNVSVILSPVRNRFGKIIGASKIARNISERKQFEQRLQETVNELKDIKSALDEHSIVAITDATGKITYINDKFCAISQYSREELLGQDHRIINSGYHSKEFIRDLWTTIARGKVWHGEIKNRAKDGSYYWVNTTLFPCLNSHGKPTQYVAIRTDITQRKADEAELQQFAYDLAEKNKELETIVSTVSHDLRSPLVNVQGFGKQLNVACEKIRHAMAVSTDGTVPVASLKQAVETSIPQALRFINAGVAKMEMLLAGLLRYSRLGRIALTIRPINMNALMAGIIASMKFQIDEAEAKVEVQNLPPCRADSEQLSQVFANLLDNALKYRDATRPLQIQVSGRLTDDGQAIYAVADNGIGIKPEHQAKAFEIFHRLNPEFTPGEGLGLAIAQRVLERQKGRIWVESTGVSGSTFYVSLPAEQEHA